MSLADWLNIAGLTSATESDDMAALAQQLRKQVEAWLRANHPELVAVHAQGTHYDRFAKCPTRSKSFIVEVIEVLRAEQRFCLSVNVNMRWGVRQCRPGTGRRVNSDGRKPIVRNAGPSKPCQGRPCAISIYTVRQRGYCAAAIVRGIHLVTTCADDAWPDRSMAAYDCGIACLFGEGTGALHRAYASIRP